MGRRKGQDDGASDLRRRAEEEVRRRFPKLESASELSPADVQELIHQLKADQIELEMQNHELRRTEELLSKSRDRFANLYDFAPVAYFTLDDKGAIVEVNLAGAESLGVGRQRLLKRRFSLFVAPESQDRFHVYKKSVFEGRVQEACELKLLREDRSSFWAHLEAAAEIEDRGNLRRLRIAVADISARKCAEEALEQGRLELEDRVSARTAQLLAANRKLKAEMDERFEAEEALRESERKYRELVENANSIILRLDTEGRVAFFNEYAESFFGYPEEEIVGQHVVGTIVPPTESGGRDLTALLEAIVHDPDAYAVNENENMRRNGERVWIAWTNKGVFDEHGALRELLCIGNDITRRKQAESFLYLQKELGLALAATDTLQESMEILLKAGLEIEGMDSGGIYLVDEATEGLRLACHHGVSESLLESVTYYEPDALQTRFARRGKPRYWNGAQDFFGMNPLLAREGILSLATLPVLCEGELIALFNLASHVKDDVPAFVRFQLESLAARFATVIRRVKLAEEVELQRGRLHEANVALKVLLKQREHDRTELEDSLGENVRHLIFPYLGRLKETRLTESQRFYVEMVDANLQEITAPFVRRLSGRFPVLTATEIRVADLIRQGKTSKEIAAMLGSSERAILFHRQSIRRKLGISQQKVNLQSYLTNQTI